MNDKIRFAIAHSSGRDLLMLAVFAAVTLVCAGLLFTPRWGDALVLLVLAGGQLVLALRDLVRGG